MRSLLNSPAFTEHLLCHKPLGLRVKGHKPNSERFHSMKWSRQRCQTKMVEHPGRMPTTTWRKELGVEVGGQSRRCPKGQRGSQAQRGDMQNSIPGQESNIYFK